MHDWNLELFSPPLSHSSRRMIFDMRPTGPFAILLSQDQEMGEFYLFQKCRESDIEAPKS